MAALALTTWTAPLHAGRQDAVRADGFGAAGVFVGGLDGDSKDELALLRRSGVLSGDLWVLAGGGGRVLVEIATPNADGEVLCGLAGAADWNQDGCSDISTCWYLPNRREGERDVWRVLEGPNYEEVLLETTAQAVRLGPDVDGDGRRDYAVVGRTQPDIEGGDERRMLQVRSAGSNEVLWQSSVGGDEGRGYIGLSWVTDCDGDDLDDLVLAVAMPGASIAVFCIAGKKGIPIGNTIVASAGEYWPAVERCNLDWGGGPRATCLVTTGGSRPTDNGGVSSSVMILRGHELVPIKEWSSVDLLGESSRKELFASLCGFSVAVLRGPGSGGRIVVGAPGAMMGRGSMVVAEELGAVQVLRGAMPKSEGFGSWIATGGDWDGDGRDDIATGGSGRNEARPAFGYAEVLSGRDLTPLEHLMHEDVKRLVAQRR
jgi:hypothetical protein